MRKIPNECYQELGDMWNAGARPTCVAFPYPGGSRWVILAGSSVSAWNIDNECFQHLVKYAQGLRPAETVAFTKNGHTILDATRDQAMMSDSLGMPTGNIGANAGFRCQFKGYPKKKAGFAIMTNGDAGDSL